MGFPLHSGAIVSPGTLFLELVVEKANTDLSRWPELDLLWVLAPGLAVRRLSWLCLFA